MSDRFDKRRSGAPDRRGFGGGKPGYGAKGRSGPAGKPMRPRHHDDDASPAKPERSYEVPTEERIAKAIARAGIASRRDAEAMIAEGRVTLNGEVLESPAVNVTAQDVITVDGEPLPAKERTRLWLFHKPSGLVTTARDPQGRETVFDHLPDDLPRVITVGRLDINTEGLLLLTNDGGLARVIAHPNTGWLRRYKVRAHGEVTQAQLDNLKDGITIDEIDYGPIEARLDREQGDNVWISMGLREGKNREIKRILEHLGLQVNRLIRLSFGPFQLGDLESGLVEEVRTRVLKDQLGTALAEEAGVDFESPVREPIAPFGREPHNDRGPRREERSSFRRDDGDRPPRRGQRWENDDRRGRDRDDRGRDKPWERDRGSADRPTEEKPKRFPFGERKPTVWRDDDVEAKVRKSGKPRRGEDPKAARAASAAGREHERVGAIETDGRTIVVERLKSAPEETHAPDPRDHSDRARFPRGEDRPMRRSGPGEGFKSRGPRRDDEGFKPRDPRRDDEGFRPRGEGEGFRPRGPRGEGEGFKPRGPRRDDEGFKPRGPRGNSEGFKPRGPRRDNEGFRPRGPRSEGEGFKPRGPRGDGEGFRPRGPRSEGEGFRPRGPRSEGEGFKPRGPRGDGEGFKPRGPRRDGEGFKPRGPRSEGEGFRPRGPRSEGEGFKPRGPRGDGEGFKPRGPRRDGEGFKPRGPRSEGEGFKPRGPRREGEGFKPRGPRSGGEGFKPRGGKGGPRGPRS